MGFDVLSDVLGMQLDLTTAEHRVGGFSLDLIGKDLDSGETVIVENQLEPTDHGHLGQLLTYAGGTDPRTIIWCAPSFRDEHRAALDWLNEHTDEDTRFFGVEISAVQIDDSKPAPLFRLVAQPNDWTKQVHTQKAVSVSPKSAAYERFWTLLLERVHTRHPDWTRSRVPSTVSWMTMPYGSSHIWYGMNFVATGPAIELYFGGPSAEGNLAAYEKFLEHRDAFEERFGGPLLFDRLDGRKACRISYRREEGGDVLEEQDHDAYVDWFIAAMERFRPAAQHVRGLISAQS